MINLPSQPRLLIVKLSAIGDCLLASPVARALRVKFPDAHIAWVVQSKSHAVVEGNPFIDETIIWQGAGVGGALTTVREIRRRRFDALLDLQGLLKSALLVRLSGAKVRLVSNRAKPVAQRAANVIVPMPEPVPHAAQQYLRMAAALDANSEDCRLIMPLDDCDRQFADDFLRQHNVNGATLVGVNPSASRPIKRWQVEKFAAIADAVAARGAIPMVFGSPTEMADAQRLVSLTKCPPLMAAGKTTLRQLAALLERCAVLVTADTGPMHVATAVGTPVVAVFGPTDPFCTGPVGDEHIVVTKDLPCRPCLQKPTCQRFECLTDMTVDDVLPAVLRILERAHRSVITQKL
jgi:lipopolysaccharide heptosyltransferase II